MRGRRPKPAELKERIGNPGRRAIPADPAPEVEAVEPAEVSAKVPEGLTGRAAQVWCEIAPVLAQLRFVRATDLQALKRYCVWVARWWEASEDVEANGSHYETSSPHVEKMLRLNPAFSVMRVAEDRCQGLEAQFGFNPSARMRIAGQLAAGNTPRQDPLPGMPAAEAPSDQPAPSGSAVGILARGGTVH